MEGEAAAVQVLHVLRHPFRHAANAARHLPRKWERKSDIKRANWEAGGRRDPYIGPMIPKPFTWDRAEARTGKFNGKFIIGVQTTGIYTNLRWL
jgi:hypothetical protein